MCLLLYWAISYGEGKDSLINRYTLNSYKSLLVETAQPVLMKE